MMTKLRGFERAGFAALTLLALFLCRPAEVRAQWASGGGNTTTPDKVGVGTSSAPTSKVQVVAAYDGDGVRVTGTSTGPLDPAFGLYDGAAARGFFGLAEASTAWSASASAGDVVLRADTGRLHLQTGTGAASLTISGGNVGVGTTSPLALLHVANSGGLGSMRLSGSGAAAMSFLDTAAPSNQRHYQWRSEGGAFRMSLVNDTDGGFLLQNILVADHSGNVGVGTANPDTYGDGGAVNYLALQAVGTNQHAQIAVAGTGAGNGQIVFGNATTRRAIIAAVDGSHLLFYVNGANSGTAATEAMRITSGGRVGIGTPNPGAGYKLDVAGAANVGGNLNVTGDITGANIAATYQDVAEWVPSTQKLSAGTVVVLDTRNSNHVLASATAYDTKVAGVVSARPGIALGEAGEGRALVATTGRVKVKVDATRAPVRIGDLLVTSDAEGVAMRSEPVSIGGRQFHAPGTIIGKALEPLEGGTGEILVLLSLQ